MKNFIYKICFLKHLASFANVTESDFEKISSLDIESSFDFENGDFYFCYVISNEIEITKYCKILEKNLISFKCENISDAILKNEYDISYIKNHLDEDNNLMYKVFLKDLDKWIYSNLDIDTILDMINLNGMKSLRKVDKKFLKNNHKK